MIWACGVLVIVEFTTEVVVPGHITSNKVYPHFYLHNAAHNSGPEVPCVPKLGDLICDCSDEIILILQLDS